MSRNHKIAESLEKLALQAGGRRGNRKISIAGMRRWKQTPMR